MSVRIIREGHFACKMTLSRPYSLVDKALPSEGRDLRSTRSRGIIKQQPHKMRLFCLIFGSF